MALVCTAYSRIDEGYANFSRSSMSADWQSSGGETTIWNGDKASEGLLHETSSYRQPIQGVRDPVVESLFEYSIRWAGPSICSMQYLTRRLRAGFPRILKLFDKYKIPFTVNLFHIVS